MITYFLIGNWMGPFRTESNTESIEKFLEWANKWEFSKDENNVYVAKNARVVIEKLEDPENKLGNVRIGI